MGFLGRAWALISMEGYHRLQVIDMGQHFGFWDGMILGSDCSTFWYMWLHYHLVGGGSVYDPYLTRHLVIAAIALEA